MLLIVHLVRGIVASNRFLSVLVAILFTLFIYILSRPIYNIIVWSDDIWFDSDNHRIYDMSINAKSQMYERSNFHPVLSVVLLPLTDLVQKLTGVGPIRAYRVINAVTAGAWMFTFLSILLRLRVARLVAVSLAILAGISSASLFWFSVPENWPLGSLSILICLWLALLACERELGSHWCYFAQVITLGTTVTNWMAGLVLSAIVLPLKKQILIAMLTLLTVVGVSLLSVSTFPHAPSVSMSQVISERGWLFKPEAGGFFKVAAVFFAKTVVMPDIMIRPGYGLSTVNRWTMSIQGSPFGHRSNVELIADCLWLFVLCMGLIHFIRYRGVSQFRSAVFFVLLGQFLFHLAYGAETFLYSLHFLPLLVLIAAFTFIDDSKPIKVGLLIASLLFTAINNIQAYKEAAQCLRDLHRNGLIAESERHLLKNNPLGVAKSIRCSSTIE